VKSLKKKKAVKAETLLTTSTDSSLLRRTLLHKLRRRLFVSQLTAPIQSTFFPHVTAHDHCKWWPTYLVTPGSPTTAAGSILGAWCFLPPTHKPAQPLLTVPPFLNSTTTQKYSEKTNLIAPSI